MSQLLLPGENKIRGPWIIGAEELEELDEIATFIAEKIKESSSKRAEIDIKHDYDTWSFVKNGTYEEYKQDKMAGSSSYSKLESEIILTSKDDKKLIDSTIKNLLQDPKLQDFAPQELELTIACYKDKFNIKFDKYYNSVIYTTRCYDEPIQQEVNYKIRKWLEKYQPKKAKEIWGRFYYIFGFQFLWVGMVFGNLIFQTVTYNYKDYKSLYRNELVTMIKSGVNANNQAKALETLIKYDIDYSPTKQTTETVINKGNARIAGIFLCMSLFAFIRPKNIIGLGKNKWKLSASNYFTKFVLVTIPAVFIIPYIFDFLKNLAGLK